MNFPEFPLPLADAKKFPQARILATAEKFTSQLQNQSKSSYSQFFLNGHFTKNGRSALARIIKLIGLKEGETILLPEYFCPAMVEPFYNSGIKVKFYNLHGNLAVNKASFESLIDENVKACLFVSYFGISNDMKSALSLAKKFNLLAIEDCAHNFFSRKLEVDGFSFDASICSLNKFFPCSDGGMFRLNSQYQYESSSSQRELKEEVKAVLSFIKLDKIISRIKSLLIKSKKVEEADADIRLSEYRYFNPQHKYIKSLKISEFIVCYSNFNKITSNRKSNYDLLYNQLKNSKVGRPLLCRSALDTPYIFPFLLNDKEDFEYIRNKGIQILRWEEFYPVENEIIESYRSRLIQVPCHQNLSAEQLSYIVSVINKENT